MPLHQSTGNSGGRCAFPGWDYDAHPIVTTSSHGAAPGINHEADQEPNRGQKERERKKQRTIINRKYQDVKQ